MALPHPLLPVVLLIQAILAFRVHQRHQSALWLPVVLEILVVPLFLDLHVLPLHPEILAPLVILVAHLALVVLSALLIP